MRVAAIVPAAGAGRRLKRATRKLFVPLAGAPLLIQTLRALERCPSIRWIIPVTASQDQARAAGLLVRHKIAKALAPCVGGASRAESVARGFAALPKEAEWVLVHDGARPCVSPSLIEQAVQSAKRDGAVACGLPASLTVKAVDEGRTVRVTLDREQLWFVQTPQVFRREWFAQALSQADRRLDQFPDDAAMLEAAGFPVRMIPGDPLNLKITTKDDLTLAEVILKARNHRRS